MIQQIVFEDQSDSSLPIDLLLGEKMRTIEIGPGLRSNLSSRIWEHTVKGSVTVKPGGLMPLFPYQYSELSTDSTVRPHGSWIFICKGTVPTDFSELTSVESRSSDRLVTFSGRNSSEFITYSNFDDNPVTISTVYKQAEFAGIATWFRLVSGIESGWSSNIRQIVGTIGSGGSGSDLEMSNVNIIAGNFYRIVDLKFNLPFTAFTY